LWRQRHIADSHAFGTIIPIAHDLERGGIGFQVDQGDPGPEIRRVLGHVGEKDFLIEMDEVGISLTLVHHLQTSHFPRTIEPTENLHASQSRFPISGDKSTPLGKIVFEYFRKTKIVLGTSRSLTTDFLNHGCSFKIHGRSLFSAIDGYRTGVPLIGSSGNMGHDQRRMRDWSVARAALPGVRETIPPEQTNWD